MYIITLSIVGFFKFLHCLEQHYGKLICFHHQELWLGRLLLSWSDVFIYPMLCLCCCPEIGTGSIDWAEPSSFHVTTEIESSL
jgi:hypothetical protein